MTGQTEIRVAFLPELAGEVSNAVCIVIDALRATTVIATLFERNCPCVYVAPSHALAESFARANGYALCGETNGVRAEGFDYGNSPTEFSRLDFSGRSVVLSTSNGTKATAAVANAKRVYLGSALNRNAVAQEAWETAKAESADIVIVCSGTNGAFTLEDATVAGLYVEALVALGTTWNMPSLADSAIAARRLWQGEPNLLRGWMEGKHAQHLGHIGFGEDVGFCAAVDNSCTVPTLVSEETKGAVACPVTLVKG